jgi:3-oxoacyl-[acyl-carrier protein] reductase
MVQPHYGKTLIKPGGWEIDDIRQYFKQHMQPEFGALGMLGKPYPFNSGVKPPVKE